MEKSIKIHAKSHLDLNELVTNWNAPSMKEAISKMVQYFQEKHINPFDEKPLNVAEQISKLKDTVISYHKTAERKQKNEVDEILAHNKVVIDQTRKTLNESISKKEFFDLEAKIRSVLNQSEGIRTEMIGQFNKVIENVSNTDKYRKQAYSVFEEAFSDVLSARNAIGVIGKEEIEKIKNKALNSLIRL